MDIKTYHIEMKNVRENFSKEIIQQLKTHKKLFRQGIVVIGSSLLNQSSDIDMAVGKMSPYKIRKTRNLFENIAKDQAYEYDFTKVNVIQRFLHEYLGNNLGYSVVRMIVKGTRSDEPTLTPDGWDIKEKTYVLGIFDIIFQDFACLPLPLFEKGSLYKWVNHTHIASRGSMPVENIVQNVSQKLTSMNIKRVKELVKESKNRKVIWKIFVLLMRGWKIKNCLLQGHVPEKVSKEIESLWLSMMAMEDVKRTLKKYTEHVQFWVLNKSKKILISPEFFLENLDLDENLMFKLPSGISVHAFRNFKDMSLKNKLDTQCCVCKENHDEWKTKNVCWRSPKCTHVMCVGCHKRAIETHRDETTDAMGNRIVSSKDFVHFCAICGHTHPISKMMYVQ